jgi:hypothetical protein
MLQEYVRRWPAAAAPTPPPSRSPSGPTAIDIFLSYSRQNLAAMSEVEAVLRGAGLSVWTDEGLEAGTPSWTDTIEEAVVQAQAMVVLLSPAAKASVWVKREVALADDLGKRIYPILIEGDTRNAVPFQLIDVQWVDGRQGLQEAAGRVLAQMGQGKQGSGAAIAPAPLAGDEELMELARRVKEAELEVEKAALQQRIEAAAREAARLRASRDPLGALEQTGLEWVTIGQLIQYLKDGEEHEAASLLADCSLNYLYVDTLFEINGYGMYDMFDVNIEAPRKVIKQANESSSLKQQIESAIRDWAQTSSEHIRNIFWVPKLVSSARTPAEGQI